MVVNESGLRTTVMRRSTLEIHLDILKIVKGGIKKPTRIMYASNLSWRPMCRNLRSLVSSGFLREIKVSDEIDRRSPVTYEITKKGENVLRYLSSEVDILDLMEITHTIAFKDV